MFKKLLIIILTLFIFTGCEKKINQDDDIERIRLTTKYYNKGEFIKINKADLLTINENKESYALFIYNNYCSFTVPCDEIFLSFMKKYDIDFLEMKFEDFKDTAFYEKVKYAQSIIIVDKGEIIAFLDAESDEDLDRYQDTAKFEEWMNKFVYFTK